MGACASAPTETTTETTTTVMTLANIEREVREMRALVVETSVKTMEETRAAAARAETSGREEREKLVEKLAEKTTECEHLRRERDLVVANAVSEASGAVRALREELETLRRESETSRENFDRERERRERALEELDGHVSLAMDVLRKTLEEEVVRARCRESSPLKPSRDPTTSAPTSPHSEETETRRALAPSFDGSSRETLEEAIEARVRERVVDYETKFREMEARAESYRARCESLDARLARDRLALFDAAGSLETRARLVSTLRSRIESLEYREHQKLTDERGAIGTTTRSNAFAHAV